MRFLLLLLAFAALCTSSLFAQGPAGDSAASPIPEIAQAQAEHEKAVQERAEDPYRAGLKQLNDAYRGTVNGLLKKATTAGSLDQALVAKQELGSFSVNETVPSGDEPGLDPEIVRIRKAWRAEETRLQKQRNVAMKQLVDAHIERLRLVEVEFTKALKLDEAKAAREKRDQASRDVLAITELLTMGTAAPASPLAPPPPPVAPASTPAPPKPVVFSGMTRPAERMDLYASGNNGCQIRINGKEVGTAMRDKPAKFRVGLHEGDVIAVRQGDRFDINSLWIACIATTGEFLFETTPQWISYLPTSADKWWMTKTAKEQKPAEPAPDRQEYVNLVKASAATTPHAHGAQPIRSALDSGARVSYLYYIVTKTDLMPKPVPSSP